MDKIPSLTKNYLRILLTCLSVVGHFLSPSNSHASHELETRSELKTIIRPLNSSDRATFVYSYQTVIDINNAPSDNLDLIFIPGGPGQTSIDELNISFILLFRKTILTDPRGVGKNANYWTSGGSTASLSSETVADDIIAIIKNENLQNYVIYGTSYGTVVATIAAAKIAKDQSLSQPKSVILEGAFGPVNKNNLQPLILSFLAG